MDQGHHPTAGTSTGGATSTDAEPGGGRQHGSVVNTDWCSELQAKSLWVAAAMESVIS